MEKKRTFDTAAQAYDAVRPSYPDEVVDWVIAQTGLQTRDAVLEIAPGTGQATLPFARRGYTLHCVELGESLAALLRQHAIGYPVTVDVAPFEQWMPPPGYLPRMILCATAFHWLDPAVRYVKCHALLADHGNLVLMWNAPATTRHPAVEAAYDLLWSCCEGVKPQAVPHEETIAKTREEIDASGWFAVQDVLDHCWVPECSRKTFTDAFFTQSAFLSLDAAAQQTVRERVQALYATLDDPVAMPMYTTAYIAGRQ